MIDFFLKPFTAYTDPASFAVPFYFVLMGFEMYLSSKQNLELYNKKDTQANLLMTFGFTFVVLFAKAIFYYIFVFVYQYRIIDIPVKWWAWIILLFAEDFTFYWYHRLHHEVRVFWAAHIVHHSTKQFNFSTSFRQPWAVVFYYNVFWLWLPLIGFQPWMVLTMMSINLIYQYGNHTTLVGKLGFLEWFMNTPSHHEVHHGSDVKYLDKNLGGIFIIWDRLFGTFQEKEEKPNYGLTNNINTYNILTINFHEYVSIWNDVRKSRTFINKVKYLFYPPGWSHDGSSKTSKQLQRELLKSNMLVTTNCS
jgi:sterol desaturase/sphingolipid hydroxylase (fatty acid hydroxylase superfamily)